MAFDTWLFYLFAVIGLALAPGPNSLLALSHGAIYGKKKVLATISGGVSGFIVLIALSMCGIGAAMQASSQVFTALKWGGGIYLIYLGIQLWRSPNIDINSQPQKQHKSTYKLFQQGLLAAISNPKVLLFFGAFLPQFMSTDQAIFPQFIVMAATFACVEFCVEYLVARAAIRLQPWLSRKGKTFNRGCGGIFALLGASLPLTQ